MVKDYFFLAVKNVRRRGLRSWLTMLGIFIGIAAVVSLISLGQGLQGAIDKQFQQLGSDKIIIQSKTIGPPGSATSPSLILTTKDLDVIKSISGVKAAAGLLMKTIPVDFKKERKVIIVLGFDEDYLNLFKDATSFQVINGRELNNEDKTAVVAGYNNAYGDTWANSIQLRDTISIEGTEFKVVGIRGKIGNPFDDAAVSIPKAALKKIANSGDEESEIVVRTDTGYNPSDVAKTIEDKLRKFRGEKKGQETFSVTTSEQLLQSFSTIFSVVQAVLIGIAAISLLVGGVGIMNTMYTAVLERTKEIGIMKAIGAKNSHIAAIFLFESGILGLFGGVIGVILGFGLGKLAELIASQALGSSILQASFPLWLILGALAFGFGIGSLSGLLPALQASRLKPTDALRYE